MANTGIALKGSPANPLYNPAGLITLTDSRLSVSGSTYALADLQFDNPGFSEPISFSNFTSVPNMVVGSKRIDKWTVAYGIFSPIAVELGGKMNLKLPAYNGSNNLSLLTKNEEQYVGAASARDTGNGWSMGIGLFAHRFHELSLTTQHFSENTGAFNIASSERIESQVISILSIVGAQKSFESGYTLGFRVSLPSVQVYDEGSVYTESLNFVSSPAGATTTLTNKNYSAEYKVPLDTGIGISMDLAGGHSIFADGSVQWPAEFNTIPKSPKGKNIKLGTSLRGSLGYKHRVNEKLNLIGGLLWCPSSIRQKINGEGQQDSPLHYLGASGGVYYDEGSLRSGLGIFALRSRTDRDFFGPLPKDRTAINVYGLTLSASLRY